VSDQQVRTEITGTVWQIKVNIGDKVAEEDPIMILESMKMEIPVLSPESGVVKEILVGEGEAVTEGQVVAVLG
jgi:acetyl-CoA carboxylase biotin carboxyl carrier protein